MSASPYHIYLSTDISLNDVAGALRDSVPEGDVTVGEDEIQVSFGGWTMRVVDFREAWVATEARELAGRCADDDKIALLEASERRLELYPPEDGAAEEHVDDGLAVLACLTSLEGAVGVNPASGDFF